MLDCLVIFRFGEIEWCICPSNCDFYTLQNSVWGKANVTNYTDSFFFRRLIFFLRWGTLNKIKEDSTSPKRVCDRSYFTTQVSSDKLMSCFLNSTLKINRLYLRFCVTRQQNGYITHHCDYLR